MKKNKLKKIYIDEIDYYLCDKCDKKILENDLNDEIISISHMFGYGSKQDGVEINFDLCENCFMSMIKDINYRKKD